MAESEQKQKSLLRKVKEESEKAGLILHFQKLRSWHTDVEKWKQWKILFSWASKSLQMVSAAMKLKDTCSLEEKL